MDSTTTKRQHRRTGTWMFLGGVVVALGAIVLWFALGGFQLPGYGGMTNEAQATSERATNVATPFLVVGVLLAIAGMITGVVRMAGRSRGPGRPSMGM